MDVDSFSVMPAKAGMLAQTLKVPHPYFHCEDDQLAWLILRFDAMSNRQRCALLKQLGSDV